MILIIIILLLLLLIIIMIIIINKAIALGTLRLRRLAAAATRCRSGMRGYIICIKYIYIYT